MHFIVFRKQCISRVKEQISSSVTDDQLIVQSVHTLDELHKVCNALSKRLRHWLALSNPELEHEIEDHEKLVHILTTRKLPETTMGAPLPLDDQEPLFALAEELKELYNYRKKLVTYLEKIMERYCPNVATLAGSVIGAKLLETVGSLKKLALVHSSTIQLLGAEKALFRHLKNKKIKPPKHGYLLQHPLVNQAKKVMRGKVVRSLADKLSIAARVDYFKGEYVADKLKKELEDKFS